MSLVKSVQFVVGFAVVGGALALSGNALAADSSSVTSTQQTTTSSTSRQINQVDQTIVSRGSDQDNSGLGAPTAISPDSTGGTSEGIGPTSPSAVTTDGTAASVAAPATVTQDDNNSGSPTTTVSGGTIVTDGTVVEDGKVQVTPDVTVPAPSTTVVTSPMQAAQNATNEEAPSVPVIVFHSEILQVQPTMLNPGVGPAGVSPSVPVQPAPAKTPVPPKANGVLASIAQVLAATVVPVSFHTGLSTTYLPGLAIALVSLVVLLGSLVVSSYGQWLRRGGFVTAARSDAPTFVVSIFATPLLMGYAPASPQPHNPSLVVADYKIRTNRFPTL